MIPYPIIGFVISLIASLYILHRYEYLFEPDLQERLITLIGENKALKIGTFHLEHGGESAYLIHLSRIFEEGKAEQLCQLMKIFIQCSKVKYNRIIGILLKELESNESFRLSREGIHIVPIMASMLKKPYTLFYEVEEEGTNRLYFLYEGELPENETVIIVDDVLTTGQSIINVSNHLKKLNKNIKANHAFVFVNRGGTEAIQRVQKHNLTVHAIIDSKKLILGLYKRRFLNSKELKGILRDIDITN